MYIESVPDPPDIHNTELYGYPWWKPPRRPGGCRFMEPWELLADGTDDQDGGDDDG